MNIQFAIAYPLLLITCVFVYCNICVFIIYGTKYIELTSLYVCLLIICLSVVKPERIISNSHSRILF